MTNFYKEIKINSNKCVLCNKKIEFSAKKCGENKCWECIDTCYIKDLEEYIQNENNEIEQILNEIETERINEGYVEYAIYLAELNQNGLEWLNKNIKDNEDNKEFKNNIWEEKDFEDEWKEMWNNY